MVLTLVGSLYRVKALRLFFCEFRDTVPVGQQRKIGWSPPVPWLEPGDIDMANNIRQRFHRQS